MKSILLAGAATLIGLCGHAQTYQWSHAFGSPSYDIANAVAVDGAGNRIVTGNFMDSLDADPGPGTTLLTTTNDPFLNDIYLAKLDASGNFLWGFGLGANKNDEGLDVLADDAGNIYLCGEFTGTVDFDPGAGVTTLSSTFSGGQMFVAKYSPAGALLWARHIASVTHGDNAAVDIALDGAGNVYMAGYFQGTIDLDPGAASVNVSDGGGTSMCIVKLNSSGDYQMGFAVGNALLVNSMDVDAAGNILTTGEFFSTSDMDPSAATAYLPVQGISDIFVVKYSTAGALLWSLSMGSANTDNVNTEAGEEVRFLPDGTVALLGRFRDTFDANPGGGTLNISTAGGADVFLTRLMSGGAHMWTYQYGNSSNDDAYGMEVDAAGNIYFALDVFGYSDLDGGPGTVNVTNMDATAMIVTASIWGNYLGHYKTIRPRSAYSYVSRLFLSPSGDLAFAGRFMGVANCDSALTPAHEHTSTGETESIIAGFAPTVVSVTQAQAGPSLSMGPNPVQRNAPQLHVVASTPIRAIRVLSLSGAVLQQQAFGGSDLELDLLLDAHVPSGALLVEVETLQGVQVQKLLLQ